MAQKVVGYREMMWTCPNCGAKNPGSSRICKSCGAAMGEDVKFEQQTNAGMIKDEKIIEQAKQGPDIYCAYCGNRNPAGAKKCSRCGADLSEGKEREHGTQHSAHLDEQKNEETVICSACGTANPATALKCKSCGTPLNSTQQKEEISAAVPDKNTGNSGCRGRGCLMIIVAIILLGVFGMIMMNSCGPNLGVVNPFFGGNDYAAENTVLDAVVSAQNWQTSVQVLGPVDTKASGWRSDVPSDARNLKCEDRIRHTYDEEVKNSVEVCGTPYAIDQGNGYEKFVQDCVYNVYDSYCEYIVSKTDVIETKRANGSGPSPEAPYVAPQYSTRNESVSYTVQLRDENGKIYTLNPSSLAEYQTYTVGSEYAIEVNHRGRIVNMEKK
ncbi:MAG: zinc ribbon domain-containing protein [Anaerolineaceae bacterium]|nr:zinc ribbon domain-containing protein [Anaerolineaceae bacterium]